MNASTVNPASKKRERILMIAGGIMAVVFSVLALMYLFGSSNPFGVSMTTLQEQKKKLTEEIDTLNMKTLTMSRDRKNLEAKSKFSLPNNEEKAITDYKNRLTELTTRSGFDGCKIEYNRTRIEKAVNVRTPTGAPKNAQNAFPEYYRCYQFNVTGKVTLENFGAFLQRFYRDKTLQLIRSVAIKPIENARRVDVTITIEALSLPQTKNTSLVVEQKEDDQAASREMVQKVANRNLFAVYRSPTPPPPPPPLLLPIDPAKHTYLEGITWVNDVPQAWFNFRLEDHKVKLRQGDKFKVGKVDCEIHSIADRQIEIKIAAKNEKDEMTNSYYSLRLGDSFYDAEWLRDE